MKTDLFDFNDLFVLDLANNHQGSVNHALRIIEAVGEIARKHKVRAALKFQFRDLDTFIHPAHKQKSSNKHIPRFLSTRLGVEDFTKLADAVRAAGMITMATPFDEASLGILDELNIEVTKVASCSATDWPLLEAISRSNKPIIVSTGGLTLEQIDDLVSFFEHRRAYFALMHCVAIYPTPLERLELNQVEIIRRRHPNVIVGFSTHENPDDIAPAMVAVAKGAAILERHVGLPAEGIQLNSYSSTPVQIDRWIQAALKAKSMCGSTKRQAAQPSELESLRSLQRGVYATRDLKAGELLQREDVFFAMPCEESQFTAGQWKNDIRLRQDLPKDGAIKTTMLDLPATPEKAVLFQAIHTIKSMLNEARIALPTDFRLEFSHHYGLSRFPEVGATLIDCINRSYCKKLIIQLPGQYHPSHYHKNKEETFQVLSGEFMVKIEGRERRLFPGDILVVPQGVWHEFWTETGVIFEEISTTHFKDDSFYEDKTINSVPVEQRKTLVSHWGRFQI